MGDVLRGSKPSLLCGFIFLIFCSLTGSTAIAQQSAISLASSTLPDAPQPQTSPASAAMGSPQTVGGTITGTVLDTNQDVLQGAQVTIAGQASSATHSVKSGSNGQFEFSGLPPDSYKLTVTAPGMSTFSTPEIALATGEDRIVPAVTLSVFGGATSVTVNGNKEELAEQQVQIALQQRVGGIIPNFYSTYDWNAPPMEAKQKFQLSCAFDLRSGIPSGGGGSGRRRAI